MWWLAGQWLVPTLDYLLAGLLVAGGVLLAFALPTFVAANPEIWLVKFVAGPLVWLLKYVGYVLIVVGIGKAAIAYGETVGAANCAAAWRAKNYEATIANLKRDNDALQAAAKAKDDEARTLAKQKETTDAQISDYIQATSKLSASLAACRRASADDDRRLCDILGGAARGCRASRQ